MFKAHPLTFWNEGDSDNEKKCMLRITGFAPNCSTSSMKYLEGVIGCRLLTINGEAAIGYDLDELVQMLSNATLPVSLSFESNDKAGLDENKNGKVDKSKEDSASHHTSIAKAQMGPTMSYIQVHHLDFSSQTTEEEVYM